MAISWTKLPFPARTQEEFNQQLTKWLSDIFYEELPAKGYEVREEQIYTAFRMARTLGAGGVLMAEAGPGTGKTFAYLLPAVCYARFKGTPVVVASATGVLQAQLASPEGDIQTLSRLLGLDIDARIASDPGEYLCEAKANRSDLLFADRTPMEGWDELRQWAQLTGTGARTEVPAVSDELWQHLAWDQALPCDTCKLRGHCHVMSARRHYRAAADLVVCDHRTFSLDLLTRAERLDDGLAPLLPPYSAIVLDEGHRVPETWQRAQGHVLRRTGLGESLRQVGDLVDRTVVANAVRAARRTNQHFFEVVEGAAQPGEGKRGVDRSSVLLSAAAQLAQAMERLQEELVTDEAMNEGSDLEVTLQAYQVRLDDARSALQMLQSEDALVWLDEEGLAIVPRRPTRLVGKGRLPGNLPVIFSSATLEPEYQARLLGIKQYDVARAGVPFDLGEQALVYLPTEPSNPENLVPAIEAVLHATAGRALVLLKSMAEVRGLKAAFQALQLPWKVLWEGDAERGAQVEHFREEVHSVLVGATVWEGVDVPGEALSCCIIPALPFPAHDPLIQERRSQAEAAGQDPFLTVDLPEMLIKLKQGAGRLIRTAHDRGVIALLDPGWQGKDWADQVWTALPEDAERTDDLGDVERFLGG